MNWDDLLARRCDARPGAWRIGDRAAARNRRIVRWATVASVLAESRRRRRGRGDESQRPGEDTDNTVVVTDLNDVDRHEAQPLAQRALLAVDAAGGGQWTDDQV
jgi:hypothetical protein